MPKLRILVKFLIVIILMFSIIFSGWILWERNRNPLQALDIPQGQIYTKLDSSSLADIVDLPRIYHHILLETENLGAIEAYISLPETIPKAGLPVIIILGGLNIGIQNFELIQDPGENAIIIYQYPYSPKYWYDGMAITQIPIIRNAVLKIPAQVLTLCQWSELQPWANKKPVCILGYSFGAFFLPAVYHLAEHRSQPLNPGVLAYAGADIYDLLKTNLKKIPQPIKSISAWLAATAIYPMEPALHLPFMNNEFLIINGRKDHQISAYSWKKLHQLVPEPKTIVILDEGHMHPKKRELTMKLIALSKNWLLERGLINP